MSTYRPSLEIVTHCWSGEEVSVYHNLLAMQLTSLYLEADTSKIQASITVCASSADHRTIEVIEFFSDLFYLGKPDFEVRLCALLPEKLFRRAIGRNQITKTTAADVVWFTDCDYLFYGDSLRRAVVACMNAAVPMVYPQQVRTHRTHALGDQSIEEASKTRLYLPRQEDFYLRKMSRPIGGIQIVKGSWCREKGYLDSSGWTEPVQSDHFLQCRCDVAFRRQAGMDSASRDIPDVYRVRHSRCGRDCGKINHGDKE